MSENLNYTVACEKHVWTYSSDLRVRVCEKCDKWEAITPNLEKPKDA